MTLLVLFGLAASGKNFVGHTIANHSDYYFLDGDELLSEDMMRCIRDKQFFTQEMRDQFAKRIIDKVKELQKTHANIVLAQALYKERNREQILQAFPQAKFFMIQSTPENIHTRLRKRNDWIDEAYADKMRVHFDAPKIEHALIENNAGAAEILTQLHALSIDSLFNL